MLVIFIFYSVVQSEYLFQLSLDGSYFFHDLRCKVLNYVVQNQGPNLRDKLYGKAKQILACFCLKLSEGNNADLA